MNVIVKAACAGAMLIAAGMGSAGAQDAPKCKMQTIATLALHDDGLNFSVDGSVNNDKTFMLLDSGAQNTMVTKTEAMRLKLPAPAAAKGKKGAEDNRVQLDEFNIGGIELGKTRILASQKLSDYPTFGAVVGTDFLLQHDLELSFATNTLKFFNPLGCEKSFVAYWDENAQQVALATLSATDHRPVVEVEVDGQKMRALLDTATPISVINLAAAARAGVTTRSAGVVAMKPAGSHSSGWIAPFHKFAIGGEDIANVKIPILDLKGVVNAEAGTATPDMILGTDFLRSHHVLLSASQQRFYFSYVGGKVFNLDSAARAAGTTQ